MTVAWTRAVSWGKAKGLASIYESPTRCGECQGRNREYLLGYGMNSKSNNIATHWDMGRGTDLWKEKATSAIDMFYRSCGRDALGTCGDQKRGLGVRYGFGSHLWLNSNDGPGRGSLECVREVLEFVLMERCSWTPWNFMHNSVYREKEMYIFFLRKE